MFWVPENPTRDFLTNPNLKKKFKTQKNRQVFLVILVNTSYIYYKPEPEKNFKAWLKPKKNFKTQPEHDFWQPDPSQSRIKLIIGKNWITSHYGQ